MGVMIDGVWHTVEPARNDADGKFNNPDTAFRSWITADGSPGPTGDGGFKAAPGRYHLYICHACPWAHRTMIYRALKGLEDAISVSVVHWYKGDDGWTFKPDDEVVPDPVLGAAYLHQIYKAADANFTGRVSVPVLWDLETGTIVNNESSEIIRMFNSAFDAFAEHPERDYYPAPLCDEIDAVNDRVFNTVNIGVYKSGFARSQAAYDEAVTNLFDTLDWLEARLSNQRYLVGDQITEADWRLFTTLLRFDPVYHGHFKCNIRRLIDYPNLWNYTRELYQVPGVASTINNPQIKIHYYGSHENVNPTGIVPVGPEIDFLTPHNRADMEYVT
ncbi:MAG: glutathione S-transferase family protein [Rhodospirillaceae bacterium]|jgi:glutathionyl-hydroquinone reductase|nr:glutathione S-transferase family protein [Rhodospirillaceae bacterium]MBT5945387.1 glutathione S-transferase family protein [Rhodospirillaceae bacterium]MBT6405808.1 glutathione S-transferase family protein [Rhodospirillaceae bacterium]MBT6535074.1 glutathione S-transferase family protein [Rhodospirillaceae bacterium]